MAGFYAFPPGVAAELRPPDKSAKGFPGYYVPLEVINKLTLKRASNDKVKRLKKKVAITAFHTYLTKQQN